MRIITPNRTLCEVRKIKTAFGSLYVQVDHDEAGRPLGGSLATPGKEPDSQVQRFVAGLSETLGLALWSTRCPGPQGVSYAATVDGQLGSVHLRLERDAAGIVAAAALTIAPGKGRSDVEPRVAELVQGIARALDAALRGIRREAGERTGHPGPGCGD